MKTFEIKISGSGTVNEIISSLNTIIDDIKFTPDYDLDMGDEYGIEDSILCFSITPKE
jgi:hypothetical protein